MVSLIYKIITLAIILITIQITPSYIPTVSCIKINIQKILARYADPNRAYTLEEIIKKEMELEMLRAEKTRGIITDYEFGIESVPEHLQEGKSLAEIMRMIREYEEEMYLRHIRHSGDL